MPISPDTLGEIDAEVRGGFETRERIIEIFCGEMYAPGELDPAEVEAAVDSAIAAHKAEQTTWPAVTDCDRLDGVFDALNPRGVLALQNAGYTQSDGYHDFREAYHASPDAERVIGYCFYHGQDLERAVQGGGLYLAFGPVDPQGEATTGPRIGSIVVEELRRAGFDVRWDGTFNQRIYIPLFDWKRR
jgi:hypothetical protein